MDSSVDVCDLMIRLLCTGCSDRACATDDGEGDIWSHSKLIECIQKPIALVEVDVHIDTEDAVIYGPNRIHAYKVGDEYNGEEDPFLGTIRKIRGHWMRWVKEAESNICPYCGYVMTPTEGASEMGTDGVCKVWCAKCGEEYRYREARARNMKTCPKCGKDYEPDLPDKLANVEPWQNEQHISGYCSDKCFDEAISGSRPEYTYDKKGRRFENGVRKPFADPPEDEDRTEEDHNL